MAASFFVLAFVPPVLAVDPLFAAVPLLFSSAIDYPTGDVPHSVFAADLDGDGDLDLATANYLSNTVSVLKNNGDATFAAKVEYSTGDGPQSVCAADLDGDGDFDLAVANLFSNAVSVLKNDGNGTFAAKVDYATGDHPYSTFATDLDGDGDVDLATANEISNTVSILKNNGNGTFAAKIDYGAGSNPKSVFAADLDGDEDKDLAVASQSSNSVLVLKNDGNGTFVPNANILTGHFPQSVFAADLDGDTTLDLAIANFFVSDSSVSVLRNMGDGTSFSLALYSAGEGAQSVFAADLDNDGYVDLVTANWTFSTVSFLKNNGNGTFAANRDFVIGGHPWSVFAADLDADGDLDLAVTGNGNNVSVLKNLTMRKPGLEVWTGLVGRSTIRIGQPTDYQLVVQNIGTEKIDSLIVAFPNPNEPFHLLKARVDTTTIGTDSLDTVGVLITDLLPLQERMVTLTILSPPSEIVQGDVVSIDACPLLTQIVCIGVTCGIPCAPIGPYGVLICIGACIPRMVPGPCGLLADAFCRVRSQDPNDKAGPFGFDSSYHYVPSNLRLPFVIYFENDTSATADAADIVIVDSLDPNLDWNTLTIGEMSHPSPCSVSFDVVNGVITWTCDSINLPPDTVPPQGEGFVSYSIKPKDSLPTGTVIKNRASIKFDFNPWLYAPEDSSYKINTLDADPPTSTINPIPTSSPPDFLVSWSGNDVGSGVRDYIIYYKKDAGPAYIWLNRTPQISAMFQGDSGHTYSFFSLATDNVGHEENTPFKFTVSTKTDLICSAAKGDMNTSGNLSPADVVLMLNCVFLSIGNCDLCFADVNCSGGLSPADVVLELNGVFLGAVFPC